MAKEFIIAPKRTIVEHLNKRGRGGDFARLSVGGGAKPHFWGNERKFATQFSFLPLLIFLLCHLDLQLLLLRSRAPYCCWRSHAAHNNYYELLLLRVYYVCDLIWKEISASAVQYNNGSTHTHTFRDQIAPLLALLLVVVHWILTQRGPQVQKMVSTQNSLCVV